MKLKTVAAVAMTTVLATFSTTEAGPPSTDPPGETESTSTLPETTVVTIDVTTPEESTPELTTSTVEETTTVVPTTNDQVDQDQTVVITATVVADADTGSNTIVVEQPPQEGSQLPAEIDTGDATAVGSDDENEITQSADVVLEDRATANVLQIALIINVGAALANSGYNAVGSSPGGQGISGGVVTGDASATGLDIDQYITQAARETGDEDSDASANQLAISLWMGLGTANSGSNVITGTEVGGSGGSVGTGNASATGNDSLTDIEQYAEVLGVDDATLTVTQRATVLNVGFALANSGINDISAVAGGLLTAHDEDDDALTQDLFAMLLPALLQSYGYGPAQGSINTGDATAVGNESNTFIRQVALAASSGDGVVDIVQEVLVANMGAAGANTGGNSLGGGVSTLDAESASAIVMMAAFMSEMLALVHQEANTAAANAVSRGIDIPFQGLILRLDGAFEGLDTSVSQGGAQANIRQVSVVVSLGISNANSGGNVTESEITQGNTINSLQAGDSIAVLALDENGNVIESGDATAGNNEVVVICQRINADDVDCLKPPEPETPPTPTTIPVTPVTTPGTPTTADPSAPVNTVSGLPGTPTPVGTPVPPSGFSQPVLTGTLPATGARTEIPLSIGMLVTVLGGILLVAARKRSYS